MLSAAAGAGVLTSGEETLTDSGAELVPDETGAGGVAVELPVDSAGGLELASPVLSVVTGVVGAEFDVDVDVDVEVAEVEVAVITGFCGWLGVIVGFSTVAAPESKILGFLTAIATQLKEIFSGDVLFSLIVNP